MNLPNTVTALRAELDGDAPTNNDTGRAIAGRLRDLLDELDGWTGELADLLDTTGQANDCLDDAGTTRERKDAHAQWVDALSQLVDHLAAAIAPAAA